MRRSEKLRQIYLELRASGVEASASDLIRIAHIILQSYAGETDQLEDFGVQRETSPFVHMPVDSAMDDGGWRVLEFEFKRSGRIDDLGVDQLHKVRLRARKIIGSPWHYQPPRD